nr:MULTISPECIES: nucleotidyltransferase [Mycolicibacter]
MPEPLFDVSELHRAFAALALKLQRRNIVGHVHVVGGAAMLLAYDPDRLATRDIDALFGPDGPMIAAIHEVADENHWPASWLNNQAAVYVARSPGEGIRVFDHPHLQVVATPADHLLAMKTLAARAVRDAEDLRFLVGYLGITSAAEVWAIVERFFPGVDVPQRSRDLIDDLF